MHQIAMAITCVGLTFAAVWQQTEGQDSGTVGLAAFVSFIAALIPPEVWGKVIEKIRKEF